MGNANLNTGDNAHDDLLPEYTTYVPAGAGYNTKLLAMINEGSIKTHEKRPSQILVDSVTGETRVDHDHHDTLVSDVVVYGVSLFTDEVPETLEAVDGDPYELGMKFRVNAPGRITAIRYYRAALDTAVALDEPRIGHIWDADGVELATVTFSDTPASGWCQGDLMPLAVEADTDYTVSVNSRHFVLTAYGFEFPITNEGITAGVDAGKFDTTSGTFPEGVFHDTNYFRDIVFVADE